MEESSDESFYRLRIVLAIFRFPTTLRRNLRVETFARLISLRGSVATGRFNEYKDVRPRQ